MVVAAVFLNLLIHITNVNISIHINLPSARKELHVVPTLAKMEVLVSKAPAPGAPPSDVPALVNTLGSFVVIEIQMEIPSPGAFINKTGNFNGNTAISNNALQT